LKLQKSVGGTFLSFFVQNAAQARCFSVSTSMSGPGLPCPKVIDTLRIFSHGGGKPILSIL